MTHLLDKDGEPIKSSKPNWPPQLNLPDDAIVKKIDAPYTSGSESTDHPRVHCEEIPRTR